MSTTRSRRTGIPPVKDTVTIAKTAPEDFIEFRYSAVVKTGEESWETVSVELDADGDLQIEDGNITIPKKYIPAFILSLHKVTGVE